MFVIGYVMRIRSERRLCQEVLLNLACRWFCRLGLEDKVPDRPTFSKQRHGRVRESDLFRRLFEAVVARCIAEGLLGDTGVAVGAGQISADVQKQNSGKAVASDNSAIDPSEAPRVVGAYLDALDKAAFAAAFGAATTITPKFTAHADPASQWTAARNG